MRPQVFLSQGSFQQSFSTLIFFAAASFKQFESSIINVADRPFGEAGPRVPRHSHRPFESGNELAAPRYYNKASEDSKVRQHPKALDYILGC